MKEYITHKNHLLLFGGLKKNYFTSNYISYTHKNTREKQI